MFHKFSAAPAKTRGQKGSTRASNKNKNSDADSNSTPNHKVLPAQRQKVAKACVRCRVLRIKCDQLKPCANCVGIQAKCLVTYAPPPSPQAGNNENDPRTCESSASPSASVSPARTSMNQASSWPTGIPPNNVPKESSTIASHAQSFFASGQLASSHPSSHAGCLFPQLPHPAIPSGERPLASNTPKTRRGYYLRLFWNVYHPLLQIMNETEFAELDALPPPTTSDEYSTRTALVDSVIALGIQHSHATGLAGRILGLQQLPSRQDHHAAPSPEASWPGFEYFHRCRERMRTNAELTLDALRCHALMALYLMKGNAFRDAYNLLGIAVRKAYMAKLHRLPPSHLSEAEKTARMQLWWTLFSLDVQCSLQLGMPAASQKSLVKCSFPAEDALARYVSPRHREEGTNAYTYSIRLFKLAVIVADISACVSTADLVDDDGNSPAAFEHHAANLSSALQSLEVWRDQLPSELLPCQCGNGSDSIEMFDFDRDLVLPAWLQRQKVLLSLHYHNAYILIQRPFIRLRHVQSNDAISTIPLPDSQQPHVDLHIASALHHATIIVDTVFVVCSMSDVLYGWSDILQPLWNATLAIMAYVYTNSLSSAVPQALESLTRAQAVFESFSPNCPSALPARDIVQSLASKLQNMIMHSSCGVANDASAGGDLFTSLIDEQQRAPAELESARSSNDIYDGVLFSPFMPSESHINIPDFNPAAMLFSDP
ncbi:uncharacterized protein N7459_006022 [Penicillium hispanicum]|uniref:uncharacterized protein n=1 Tax=Penicillium hispanicum TaxID=1080232 RepID=UPI0025412448|nr:uncharacterized protein N7459_006022 [Penicillium hispanicum]KAJ5580037.1 hypothetical protein N7459_006022 [Penicillium hispanicum]